MKEKKALLSLVATILFSVSLLVAVTTVYNRGHEVATIVGDSETPGTTTTDDNNTTDDYADETSEVATAVDFDEIYRAYFDDRGISPYLIETAGKPSSFDAFWDDGVDESVEPAGEVFYTCVDGMSEYRYSSETEINCRLGTKYDTRGNLASLCEFLNGTSFRITVSEFWMGELQSSSEYAVYDADTAEISVVAFGTFGGRWVHQKVDGGNTIPIGYFKDKVDLATEALRLFMSDTDGLWTMVTPWQYIAFSEGYDYKFSVETREEPYGDYFVNYIERVIVEDGTSATPFYARYSDDGYGEVKVSLEQ